jgi:F0F1-type ATP synthase membrane subunit a
VDNSATAFFKHYHSTWHLAFTTNFFSISPTKFVLVYQEPASRSVRTNTRYFFFSVYYSWLGTVMICVFHTTWKFSIMFLCNQSRPHQPNSLFIVVEKIIKSIRELSVSNIHWGKTCRDGKVPFRFFLILFKGLATMFSSTVLLPLKSPPTRYLNHLLAKLKSKATTLQTRCGPEGGYRYISTLPWPRH